MVGKGDQITLKANYITRTAGRAPALSGSTLLHAVNNVWQDNNGHALEGGETTARGIFEGNVFINVKALSSDYKGRLFAASATNTNCNAAFKRACQSNAFYNSQGALPSQDSSFFADFAGLNIASAQSAASARANVPNNAGVGKV
jgi:pectin lyase